MLTLYYVSQGSASCRVRFLLAEKKIEYEKRVVDIQNGENNSPGYLKLNPNGLVPTLIHGDRSIWESAVISEYLEDIFPQPAMRPELPYERSLMRNWVKHIDEQCLPAMLVISWATRITPFASKWSDDELQQRLHRIPNPARRAEWLRAARNPWSEQERNGALETLEELVKRMNLTLKIAPWLAGPNFSIADVAAAAYIHRLETIAPQIMQSAKYDYVSEWWKRIQTRHGFSIVYGQK